MPFTTNACDAVIASNNPTTDLTILGSNAVMFKGRRLKELFSNVVRCRMAARRQLSATSRHGGERDVTGEMPISQIISYNEDWPEDEEI